MQHGDVSPSEEQPKKAPDQQLNRACESCRMSKVRCLVNPVPGSSQCQRCAKAGRVCIFAPPAKRRQRKRTDVRVAELEREIRQMRSLLHPNKVSPEEGSDHDESIDEEPDDPEEPEKESPPYAQSHGGTTLTSTPAQIQPEKRSTAGVQGDWWTENSNSDSEIDIVDRGIITMELADELLSIYRNDLVTSCPGVLIPRDWTAAQLRVKKPALFHAVMAAASHPKGVKLSERLNEEVVHLYARALIVQGEKSLQYVQALMVTVAYYTPPKHPSRLQVFQFINMAGTMALELGLASKPRTHEQLPKRAIRTLQRISSPEELLENCRTLLMLYIMTAGPSMRLRRPNVLPYNSWMEECLSLLQKSPLLDDRRVVAWLKLQRIADEANTAFGFDDASTSFSLSGLRLQVILRIFERRMEDWKNSVPAEVMSAQLMVEYYQNIMLMWEFAMDGGYYNAPEFRNRFLTLPALDDDCVQPESLLSRSALQINATIKCVSAAHSLLECFIQSPCKDLQRAWNVLYVRALFALVALMKIDYAVGTDVDMGELLDSQSLKVDYYLNTVTRKTEDAVGPQECRVPAHWLYVLNHKLKAWHNEHQHWRKEGRQLKRNSPQDGKDDATLPKKVSKPTETFSERSTGSIPALSASTIAPTIQTSQTLQLPDFNPVNNVSYSPWPTTSAYPVTNNTSMPGPNYPTAIFPSEMGDFSAAFQHGDLYLWNDMSDNFGGWIATQGEGMYNDLNLETLNGPGM
ncbi:hypothetical protein P154DRAFT_313596 [Amniculicola lignicola CBS 123094]|uniref:Zn(2)-C6 fungal-type domain-containing protein n=1 Tax=Amniculicola lignicola CBS 123094 TaxID=1392246 RepID=A0A6A5WV55_9PLEO|nr:hypothetical protein P154DRAFT_313596 [Amniculicola lignicola CBS 123094]